MTDLLYQTDSYIREFDAEITAVNPDLRAVNLDQTAFYPGGGGQPADEGTLTAGGAEYSVPGFRKQDGVLWHLLGGDAPLPEPGAAAHGALDWERRYQLMRTHTAMHILCGVVFRDYGASVTGGDMHPLQGRMDFEFETMRAELVAGIQEAINAEVAAARPLRVRILPRRDAFAIPDLIRTKINLLPEGIPEVRVVEIEGLDLQADGGTHVANTREVGRIRVADYKSKGAINKRIYVTVEDA
ncbi:MAG: alanyl-tRNA editing protein [Chloroflexi bacterium]|nr:alanyl-tRNA editing protein [Chloroflexota bacterium]